MTDHPIDTTYVDAAAVSKSTVRSYERDRNRIRVTSLATIQGGNYSDTFGFDFGGANFDRDTTDTTSADDGVSIIVDIVGTRFKLIKGGARERLTTDREYFVKTAGAGGSDSATGRSLGVAFASYAKCLSLFHSLDLNGHAIVFKVQGGAYTENLAIPTYVGDSGIGYDAITFLGENGAVTLNGSSAAATIFSRTRCPVVFDNMTIGNPNASGLVVECDNGGLIVLHNPTMGVIGAGGIALASVLRGSSIIVKAGALTFADDTGTGIYPHNDGSVTLQPGVTLALGSGRVFTNAFVDVASGGSFNNTGSNVTGSLGSSSVPYRLSSSTFGKIDDVTLLNSISGAGAPVVT